MRSSRNAKTEGELTETKKLQEEFWTEFRDRIEEDGSPLSARKPKPQHWYNNPIGKSGFALSFTINSRDSELRTGLVIRDDADAYWQLEEEREDIDEEFDGQLVWNEPEETRAGKERSKILVTRQGNITDEEQWEDYLNWMLGYGEQFHEVFYDRIQRL